MCLRLITRPSVYTTPYTTNPTLVTGRLLFDFVAIEGGAAIAVAIGNYCTFLNFPSENVCMCLYVSMAMKLLFDLILDFFGLRSGFNEIF